MSLTRASLVRTLTLLVVSGCIEGRGSGLTGINTGNGGDGGRGPRVLSFFVQPSTANFGEIITPPVEVAARDTLGNVDSTFTAGVTVALASNPTGATLGGTRTVAVVFGIARFGDLSVNRAGTYTLRASAPGATSATSAPFTITTPTTR